MAQLSATAGKETSHKDGALLVWQVRVEGLGGYV